MTNLYRVRTQINTAQGGPGVSTMYFRDVDTAIPSLYTLWNELRVLMPDNVAILIQPFGDIIDDATGTITGGWAKEPVAAIAGGSTTEYAAPAGLLMGWETGTILNGRRVRGHTFVVPITTANMTTDGQIGGATVALAMVKGLQFITAQSASFVVWHRPRADRPATAKLKHLAAYAGGNALVTNITVKNRVAVLTSRRG